MKDPIGPGTPAWNAFDNAIEAYKAAIKHDKRKDATYRRYCNCRDRMIKELHRHGGDVVEWSKALRKQCKE